MADKIYIIGAGGVGREVAATLHNSAFKDKFIIGGFIDDGKPTAEVINGIPVLGNIQWLIDNIQSAQVVIALGNPKIRRDIINRLKDTDFSFPNIIHPNVQNHSSFFNSIGKGVIISDGCILTTNVRINDFCLINVMCSFHHDTTIGENTVVMPGVHITSGFVIGRDSFVGAGSILSKQEEYPSGTYLKAGTITQEIRINA